MIQQQKKELRQQIERYRRTMPVVRIPEQVFQPLIHHSWFVRAKCVAMYLSQEFEFPTSRLFDFCTQHGKKIVAPAMENSDMIFRRINAWKSTDTNRVANPDFGEVVESERIDVFFVPLVGFDWNGGRLGRGGGNYDRIFPNPLVTGIKVGLGYEFQSCLTIPQDKHDIKMDYILTEKTLRRIL